MLLALGVVWIGLFLVTDAWFNATSNYYLDGDTYFKTKREAIAGWAAVATGSILVCLVFAEVL